MAYTDFPNTDAVADALVNNTYITMPTEFERALRLTAVAALDNAADPRAQLHALTFAFTANQLNIYATDSFRLALQTLDIAYTNDLTFMLLVAGVQTNLLSLLKQLQPESEIKLYDLTNQVLFQLECKNFSALLVMQKVAGTPMNVLGFIPKDTSVILTLDRVELIAALQAAQVFGKDNHNKVYLDFCNEPTPRVTLSSTGDQSDTGHVNTLELQSLEGSKQFFAILNALYFLEYLKASTAEVLQISKRVTERSPLICRDADALAQGLYLMMPMVENSVV